MLVLSRKESESLLIGKDIKIAVLGYERGQVRIGIEAPKTTNIIRSELLERQDEFQHLEWFGKK
jgi:carbon storage regulator